MPTFQQTCVVEFCMCVFEDSVSSKVRPKNFVSNTCLIDLSLKVSLIFGFGLVIVVFVSNNMKLILSMFKDSLLDASQLSCLTVQHHPLL